MDECTAIHCFLPYRESSSPRAVYRCRKSRECVRKQYNTTARSPYAQGRGGIQLSRLLTEHILLSVLVLWVNTCSQARREFRAFELTERKSTAFNMCVWARCCATSHSTISNRSCVCTRRMTAAPTIPPVAIIAQQYGSSSTKHTGHERMLHQQHHNTTPGINMACADSRKYENTCHTLDPFSSLIDYAVNDVNRDGPWLPKGDGGLRIQTALPLTTVS